MLPTVSQVKMELKLTCQKEGTRLETAGRRLRLEGVDVENRMLKTNDVTSKSATTAVRSSVAAGVSAGAFYGASVTTSLPTEGSQHSPGWQ